MVDKTGQDAATLAAEWGATMWWLNFADGLLPIGDIIYWGGLGLLTIGAIIFVDYAATTYSDTSYSKPTSSSKQNAEPQAKYASDFGSTTAPPPGHGLRRGHVSLCAKPSGPGPHRRQVRPDKPISQATAQLGAQRAKAAALRTQFCNLIPYTSDTVRQSPGWLPIYLRRRTPPSA